MDVPSVVVTEQEKDAFLDLRVSTGCIHQGEGVLAEVVDALLCHIQCVLSAGGRLLAHLLLDVPVRGNHDGH